MFTTCRISQNCKRHFPFSAIGADHGIEQLHRELKEVGGVKGLLKNENALDHFILCAPVLDSVCKDFRKRSKLKKESRDKHYQLTGTTNSRISGNVDKLLSHFKSIEFPFESSEHMIILLQMLFYREVLHQILTINSIGKKMYENIKSERIYGEKRIWDAMKMCKLQTFKSSGATIKTKIEGKLIELKEDKPLLQRVLTILQKHPEINLPKLIGENEFSNIPRLMFSIGGKILPCTNKSQILHTIEISVPVASMPKRSLIDNTDEKPLNAVITDAMALLNKI